MKAFKKIGKAKIGLSSVEKRLVRRYLVWCYKTTKEDLDRIDRYFTQLLADEHILKILKKSPDLKNKTKKNLYGEKVSDFKKYMDEKKERVIPQKFYDPSGEIFQPDYWYLTVRLSAVEQTIKDFLGIKELKAIQKLYESEMIRRIMEAREHT